MIDERIAALSARRANVRARLLELERLELSRAEADELFQTTHTFVETVGDTLRSGSPEQRVITIRRCIVKIVVDTERKVAVMTLRAAPQAAVGECGEASTVDIEVALPTADGRARASSAAHDAESNGQDRRESPVQVRAKARTGEDH